MIVWGIIWMIAILLICVTVVIYYIIRYDHYFLMTKKEKPRQYAKNREEYFREFHRVIAPVVVLKVEGKDD